MGGVAANATCTLVLQCRKFIDRVMLHAIHFCSFNLCMGAAGCVAKLSCTERVQNMFRIRVFRTLPTVRRSAASGQVRRWRSIWSIWLVAVPRAVGTAASEPSVVHALGHHRVCQWAPPLDEPLELDAGHERPLTAGGVTADGCICFGAQARSVKHPTTKYGSIASGYDQNCDLEVSPGVFHMCSMCNPTTCFLGMGSNAMLMKS